MKNLNKTLIVFLALVGTVSARAEAFWEFPAQTIMKLKKDMVFKAGTPFQHFFRQELVLDPVRNKNHPYGRMWMTCWLSVPERDVDTKISRGREMVVSAWEHSNPEWNEYGIVSTILKPIGSDIEIYLSCSVMYRTYGNLKHSSGEGLALREFNLNFRNNTILAGYTRAEYTKLLSRWLIIEEPSPEEL